MASDDHLCALGDLVGIVIGQTKAAHAVLRINAQEYADKDCRQVLQGNGQVLSVKEQGAERIVEILIEANDYLVL